MGLAGLPRSSWLRLGLTFAAFEGLMPVIGLLLGGSVSAAFGEVAGYAAAAILIVVGLAAVREALSEDDGDVPRLDAGIGGRKLLLTGLSVSLDELAVGFSLGVLKVPVGPALTYIAVQAFGITFLGLAFGGRLGARLGNRAELASGIVLAFLGLALLISQATGTHLL